jgi:hypothetical protein
MARLKNVRTVETIHSIAASASSIGEGLCGLSPGEKNIAVNTAAGIHDH